MGLRNVEWDTTAKEMTGDTIIIHKDCFPLKNTGSKIKYFCQSISKKENLEGHLRGQ